MTLNGHFALFQNTCVFGAHHVNLNEDGQKWDKKMKHNDCSFWQCKVYADIRGGWRRGVKRQWDNQKRPLSGLSGDTSSPA